MKFRTLQQQRAIDGQRSCRMYHMSPRGFDYIDHRGKVVHVEINPLQRNMT